MSSLNKALLIGRCGRDPEIKSLPSGDSIANVSLATSESWRDKATGEKKEQTEWHRLVFFGRLAEIVETYVRKGDLIYVEGKIKSRKYQDKDGAEKMLFEIACDRMTMLGGRSDKPEETKPNLSSDSSAYAKASGRSSRDHDAPIRPVSDLDEDIPF